MLTTDGAARLLQQRCGPPETWSIAVSDGTQRATAPVESAIFDGSSCTLTALFGADEANFDWAYREVIVADGTVLDVEAEDNGRKAEGAEWTMDVTLTIGSAESALPLSGSRVGF